MGNWWDDDLNPSKEGQRYDPYEALSEARGFVKQLKTYKDTNMHYTEQNMPTNAAEFYKWVKQQHPNEEVLVKDFIAAAVNLLNNPGTSLKKEVSIESVLSSCARTSRHYSDRRHGGTEENGFKFRQDFDQRDGSTYLLLQ